MRDVEFISVYEEDWDNLIILDACRYDIFEEEYSGTGELQLRYSKTPQSPSFFQENFKNKTCHDTVSVTGNPYHKKVLKDEQFHSVYHLWKTHWNEHIKTVHPQDIVEISIKICEFYPQKRLMIHFMQPHAPFIAPWGRDNIGIHVGNEHSRKSALNESSDLDTTGAYDLAAEGNISDSKLERGYRENLNFTLEHLEDLISQLDGKTIITADHGELLGDRAWPYPWKDYQHPPLKAEKLLEVPWLIIDPGERREIESDKPSNNNNNEQSTVDIEQRLSYLGYK